MTRRLPTTLTDYVFWLINPALIMLLLDSFTFYLLEAHYSGEHHLRLFWAFAFFNMGIVACARISLIEGASAAEFLAIPLMGSMFFVVGVLSGSPLAFLLIVVLTFLAFRLARNTTILDDRDEASTAGLVGRLFAGSTQRQREARARRRAGEPDPREDDANSAAYAAVDEENDGPATPLARLIARIRGKKVDETPGLSVLYMLPMTLAAMGISSWFMPQESRTYAHLLLALHLGCALILLATATFLNLRRYLRQRMIQMPERMTGVWVAAAALLLVGALLAAMILPRPGLVEPLRSELFASSNWDPHDWSMPWDGARGEPDPNANGTDGENPANDGQGSPGEGGSSESDASGSSDASEQEGSETPVEEGAAGAASGETSSGESSSGQSQGEGDSQDGGGSSGQEQSSESQSQESSSEGSSSGGNSSSGQPTQPEASPQREQAAEPPPSNDPFEKVFRDYTEAKVQQDQEFLKRYFDPQRLLRSLAFIVMFLFWLVVFAAVAYMVWRFRAAIFFAFAQWWRQLQEWFARVFRWGDPNAVAPDGAAAVYVSPPRPFSAYADPFRTGAAASWSLRDLLAYSLEALDAWSRDRRFPRGSGETPSEFAVRLALRDPATRGAVVPFADVYSQAAFAPDGPPGNTIAVVQSLWRFLSLSSGDFGGPAGQTPSPAPSPPPPPRG